jgi:hypothetical protein
MGDKSVRSGREGGMTALETPEIAAKAPLRGLCAPESRASVEDMLAAVEVAAVTGGKHGAVEIRKTLRL